MDRSEKRAGDLMMGRQVYAQQGTQVNCLLLLTCNLPLQLQMLMNVMLPLSTACGTFLAWTPKAKALGQARKQLSDAQNSFSNS